MMKQFDLLDIDGAVVDTLEIHPPKKIDLIISTNAGKQYFITFFQVAGFNIKFLTHTPREILSHQMLLESVFLKKVKNDNSTLEVDNLIHYQIAQIENTIDIVSAGYSCSLIWDARGRGIVRR